jgi:serine/threonine-protein kinase RsbW
MKRSFQIPCNTSHLKDARNFLNKVLKKTGLNETDQNAIVLAVDEVCANIIIHSECDNKHIIELNVEWKGNKLIFEIIDQGISTFDINAYTGPELDEIIQSKRKGGVGILLVKKIMDKIEIFTSNGSNICRLYKTI